MPFLKGQSGNPGGRPKHRPWAAAINRALKRRGNGDADIALDELADKLIDLVASADLQAMKEFGDRQDGKVPQTLVGDNSEDPINVITRIERVVVPVKPAG